MGQQGKQPGAASGTAALHRSGGHAQDICRLGNGVALHIDQDQRGALLDRQGGQCLDQLRSELSPDGWGLSRFMWLQQMLIALGVGYRSGAPSFGLARPVKAGVDGDSVQPGGHRGLAAEGVCRTERGDQCVLNRVSGVLSVPEGAQGHRPEPVTVAPDKLTKGFVVACYMAGEELMVTGWLTRRMRRRGRASTALGSSVHGTPLHIRLADIQPAGRAPVTAGDR